MPASKHFRTLAVRLPEPEIRRFKSLAASRGVTLQEAVHQAIENWATDNPKAPLEPLDSLQGSLKGVNVSRLRQREKHAEIARDAHWL